MKFFNLFKGKKSNRNWKLTLNSVDKIYEILNQIQKEFDCDRVIVYTLGENTSLSKASTATILQEVVRNKEIKKITREYGSKLLEEKSPFISLLLSDRSEVEIDINDVDRETSMLFEHFQTQKKYLFKVGVSNDTMLILSIHNANAQCHQMTSLLKKLLKCYI